MTNELPKLALSVVPTPDLDDLTRHEIIDLCNSAFQKDEFDVLFELIADSVDPTHVLARIDGRLVGHALWSTRRLWIAGRLTLTCAHLDAVATDPQWQGRGIGTAVVKHLMARIDGFDIGTLSTDHQSFYEHIGWQRWQGPIATRRDAVDIPTPDEPVMVLRTSRTPGLDLHDVLVIEARGGNSW